MAGGTSEKETSLNCPIQPFVKQSFDAISYVQIIALFLFLKPL